ncbi:hypothetical protein SAMN02910265_00350 [Ruminococcus flavefaciens]|uniref:Uncharacterized protein n=1 Tax=Ruminococcus flavefaciens TaxID=1265 RepID=A0A1H6HZS1_RUMFL|nr:DUF6311 domain-containing protein [Ruminococcus flavefaciens]SEH39716.1 hypothetical protein SAMN02910265_00350 [Ruminococcus flavefaciens]
MIKKTNKYIYFLAGAILGAAVFILFFGVDIISPVNTKWIFAQHDDVTQHHVGWEFFRRSPWDFPFGLIEGISADEKVSCMYTDSIPLFAIVFKLLSPILPDNFQYFGIWGIICYMLNGGFGALLLTRIKKNLFFTSVGSLFYSAFWPTLLRIMHHNSLGAIWLVIIPLILTIDHDRKYKHSFTPVILWTVTCILASLIHLYFIPMIYCVMLGYMILLFFKDKKRVQAIAVFASSTVFSVLFLWIIGGFYGSGSYTDGGFGIYSANFNTFFNSKGQAKYMRQLDILDGQYEGFGYLGLGMLILCFLSVLVIVNKLSTKEGGFLKNASAAVKSRKAEIITFCVIFAAGFFWAASNKLTINRNVIMTIPLPEFILGKLGIFRSSGRFIWLPCLMTMTSVLWICAKLNKSTLFTALTLCIAVQFGDMQNYYTDTHAAAHRNDAYITALSGAEWEEAANGAEEIVFLPLPDNYKSYMKLYFDFAELACNKHMKLSSFYLARTDNSILKAYADKKYTELKSGNGSSKYLYVFFNNEDIPVNVKGLDVKEIDGYTVARVKK